MHPNIIAIFQQGLVTTDGVEVPYYVMEYISGAQDAAEYFSRLENSVDVINVLSQILNGLMHLHSIEILHGDVKLENVLVGQSGRAVISDLGSASPIYSPV